MTVLILHGIAGHAGIHWQQWLHDELEKAGHTVLMPELPQSEHPHRREWFDMVRQTIDDTPLDKLVIVGHSLGVTTALDFLEGVDTPIKALVSVSGMGKDYGSELNSYFLKEKQIDYPRVREHIQQSVVIYGDNDPYVPQDSLRELAVELWTEPIVIPGGGHLNTESGYTTFPLLLETVTHLG